MNCRSAASLALLLSTAIPAAAVLPISDASFAASLSAISARLPPLLQPAAPSAVQAKRAAPDFSFTPGHLCSPTDPNFKEYRYPEHIPYCNRNVTRQMKLAVAAHYGVPESDWPNYEFDHLIPLALGGDSSDDNLWPQPHGDPDGSDGKDKLENLLYQQMAAGAITQAAAVKQIYDWFQASSSAAEAVKVPVLR